MEMSTLPIPDKVRRAEQLARAGWTALDCAISGTAARLKDRAWMIFNERRAGRLRRVRPAGYSPTTFPTSGTSVRECG